MGKPNLENAPPEMAERWDHISEGVLVEDGETIVYANRPYATRFGYQAPDELIGRPVSVVLSAEDEARMLDYGRSRIQGSDAPAQYTFRGRRRDGSLIPLVAHVEVIEHRGGRLISTRISPVGMETGAYRSTPSDEAFLQFYDETAPLVYGMLLRIMGDLESAAEILQECFTEAWAGRDRFPGKQANVVSSLVTMARSRAVARLREKGPGHTLETKAITDELSPQPKETEVAALKRVEVAGLAEMSLPAVQRQVIELSYLDGLTQNEIAAKLDLPLETVRMRMVLGVRKLHDHLGNLRNDH